MKWFVHVASEYYAETHIIEAATAETAAALALDQTQGNTYARYDDEGALGDVYEVGGRYATPACAVIPLADVVFIGSENRVAALLGLLPDA